jgi:hypothetical protein
VFYSGHTCETAMDLVTCAPGLDSGMDLCSSCYVNSELEQWFPNCGDL